MSSASWTSLAPRPPFLLPGFMVVLVLTTDDSSDFLESLSDSLALLADPDVIKVSSSFSFPAFVSLVEFSSTYENIY